MDLNASPDVGDATETDRTCATGAPYCLPFTSLICRVIRSSLVGETAAARGGRTLNIWQISCVAGALGAASLAAIQQIEASRPGLVTPNARVAEAFSTASLNATAVLTNLRAAFPAP